MILRPLHITLRLDQHDHNWNRGKQFRLI